MIEKAKTAKTAEELLAIAKENGVEMTADEAKTYFAQISPKSGELDDDDLDSVAGGACAATENKIKQGERVRVINGQTCPKCGGTIGTVNEDYGIWDIYCENCSGGRKFTAIALNVNNNYGVDVEKV